MSSQSVNFIDAENPVLCTKRDLILKRFGFFFFDEYFKDERFIKMKNYFMHLYPTSNQNNNYNGFEKQMKINYPSILKNFSNCNNYYPRLIIRPDTGFFKNNYLNKSHEYLEINKENKKKNEEKKENDDIDVFNYITNEDENKIMHLEYGHGLLNQINYNLLSAGNIKENLRTFGIFECEYISNRNTIQGSIILIKNFLIFQTNKSFDYSLYESNSKYTISSRKEEINQKEKQIIILIKEIEQIILRNFLFFNQAIEIFLYNGKSYFFNLYQQTECIDLVKKIKEQFEAYYTNKEIFEIIENSIDYFSKKKYCNSWLDGKISTLDYLLLINKYSGRSYNDLTQYLIIPWLLNNYSDITNTNNYRKMNLSMAIQDQENLEMVKQNYDKDKDLIKRSHFQYHYSNSSYISLYLLRLNPFTYNQIRQNGHFDSPDRQIESMQDMCIVFRDFKETSELIPEYFFMVECFLNLNFNFFGKKSIKSSKESIVNNMKLNYDFSSLLDLILFHQSFINSNEITGNVNKWIDNIFGENQMTTKKNVINSYPTYCYEKNVKEEIEYRKWQLSEYPNEDTEAQLIKVKNLIREIREKTDYAYLFGQCPPQLFQKAHPIFSFFKKSKKISTNYEENYLKNDGFITIPDKQVLYLGYKNGNANMFVLTMDEIIVYNKMFKQVQKFDINIINQPYHINIDDHNLFLKFLYKNILFEIEDCKIFFIGGYIDNSFKIYYKDKEKEKEKDNSGKETNILNIMTESQITCMYNIEGKNIFFTGDKNGKITKWKYDLLYKNKKEEINFFRMSSVISVDQVSSIIGHKSFVQFINANTNLNIIISSSNDGFIFIRKMYDYELLNIIKYNYLKRSLLDVFFDKHIIITTFYNIAKDKNKKVKINTYSVNGIKLSGMEQNISLPGILKSKTDEILLFIDSTIYKFKITFKDFNDIFAQLNEKKINENNGDNPTVRFINEINQNVPVSFHYDFTFNFLLCLLPNGKLYRIYLKS